MIFSRQCANKKSFAIKQNETNTEPLSGVNGVLCRNCTGIYCLLSSTEQRRKESSDAVKRKEKGREKGGGGKEKRERLKIPVTITSRYVREMDNEVQRGSCPTSLLFIFLEDKLSRGSSVAPLSCAVLPLVSPLLSVSALEN